MNSFQIRYYLETLRLNVHTGVYAINQLQFISAKSFAIVVNEQ